MDFTRKKEAMKMAVYKDKKRGTWYASVLYKDWTGKQCRKMRRGFATKKEAQEWETSFTVVKAPRLTMNFADFIETYEVDMRPKSGESGSFTGTDYSW